MEFFHAHACGSGTDVQHCFELWDVCIIAFYQQRAQRLRVCSHTLDAKGSADFAAGRTEGYFISSLKSAATAVAHVLPAGA